MMTTLQSKAFHATPAASLGVAFGQLISALLAPLQVPARARRASSAAEEAEDVREMAYHFLASDPRFAQDLFAAADRHELASGVTAVAPNA